MLTSEELLLVRGGGITSTFMNSLSRLMENIYRIGHNMGSSIRRIVTGKVCKIN